MTSFRLAVASLLVSIATLLVVAGPTFFPPAPQDDMGVQIAVVQSQLDSLDVEFAALSRTVDGIESAIGGLPDGQEGFDDVGSRIDNLATTIENVGGLIRSVDNRLDDLEFAVTRVCSSLPSC